MIIRPSNVNYFIFIVLLLLLSAVGYFLYNRQRTSSVIYVSVSLVRPQNIMLNIAYNSVPYWVGESISENDKEQNLLGAVGAEVLEKESYDWMTFGQVVNLILKMNAVKDRTGVYLYKNKPLLVGSTLDLKLTNSQVQAIVNEVSVKPIEHELKKANITVSGKQTDSWIADNIQEGDELKDNRGNTVAKILKLRSKETVNPLTVNRYNFSLANDASRKDFEADIEIKCVMVRDVCYFAQTQKIKVGENIYLPFSSVSLNFPVSKVTMQ